MSHLLRSIWILSTTFSLLHWINAYFHEFFYFFLFFDSHVFFYFAFLHYTSFFADSDDIIFFLTEEFFHAVSLNARKKYYKIHNRQIDGERRNFCRIYCRRIEFFYFLPSVFYPERKVTKNNNIFFIPPTHRNVDYTITHKSVLIEQLL